MSQRIYIGNIPYTATEQDIVDFLQPYVVRKVQIVVDRETQRPRGFAFADLDTAGEVDRACHTHHNTLMQHRTIVVDKAKERDRERSGSSDRGGGRSERREERYTDEEDRGRRQQRGRQ